MGTKIVSVGYQLPPIRVTNEEWREKFAPATEILGNEFTRFIAQGIEQRYYLPAGATVDEFAAQAVTDCLRRIDFPVMDVEHIIQMSNVSDAFVNGDGPKLQHRVGAHRASTIDLTGAACCGFLVAINMATSLIESGRYRNVLLSCVSNAGTRAANHRDAAGPSMGDLATAVLIVKSDDDAGMLGFCHETRGGNYHVHLHREVLDGVRTWTADADRPWGKHFFHVDNAQGVLTAQELIAVHVPSAARIALERAGKTAADIRWLVTHQPGSGALKVWRDALGFEVPRHPNTLSEVGNASFASIPFTLRRLLDKGSVSDKDLLLLAAPGSGNHAVSIVWRW